MRPSCAPLLMMLATEAGMATERTPGFIMNRGQWPSAARFVAQSGPDHVLLSPGTIALVHGRDEQCAWMRLAFLGAASDHAIRGEGPLPGSRHYFLGRDAARWQTHVPAFERVRMQALYPGVDVVIGIKDGQLEYDLELVPGADLEQVIVDCPDAERVDLTSPTELRAITPLGPLTARLGATWQIDAAHNRQPLGSRFVMRGAKRFGVEVPQWNRAQPLTVDPGLEWSTFLGGGSEDWVYQVVRDRLGGVTVAGYTFSPDLPVTPAAFDRTIGGGFDAFVARFSQDGKRLVYCTYLGGELFDWIFLMHLHANGQVTVAGRTHSPDFPVTPGAYDTSFELSPGVPPDGFVTRLSTDGSALEFSTFLGGSDYDWPYAMAVQANGETLLGGQTSSGDFPVTSDAYASQYHGKQDAFVTSLSGDGSTLIYSTFLGGAGAEFVYGIDRDQSGRIVVAGVTSSPDYPVTTGAYDTTFSGYRDLFVTRLEHSQLFASTFVGGTSLDVLYGMLLDATEEVTLTGFTHSLDYPTTPGAFDRTLNSPGPPAAHSIANPRDLPHADAFVTRLSATLGTLERSTLIGGSGDDSAYAIARAASGALILIGETGSPDFPVTTSAFDPHYHGDQDAFVTRLEPGFDRLSYSTFLGGSREDELYCLTLSEDTLVWLGGYTQSPDFPVTAGAFQTNHGGLGDGFVCALRIP